VGHVAVGVEHNTGVVPCRELVVGVVGERVKRQGDHRGPGIGGTGVMDEGGRGAAVVIILQFLEGDERAVALVFLDEAELRGGIVLLLAVGAVGAVDAGEAAGVVVGIGSRAVGPVGDGAQAAKVVVGVGDVVFAGRGDGGEFAGGVVGVADGVALAVLVAGEAVEGVVGARSGVAVFRDRVEQAVGPVGVGVTGRSAVVGSAVFGPR
jgi:hypothetical protein